MIWTSGNVFSYEAVKELNEKTKNFTDLLTGEKFVKKVGAFLTLTLILYLTLT
jgi:hypothetical protein